MSSKIKTDPEPSIYFISPSESGTVPAGDTFAPFSPGGLASQAGRVSTLYDLGPGPRTTLFEWRSVGCLSGGSGNVGLSIEQYLACSNDGHVIDGMMPSGDSAFTNADQRRNLTYLGGLTLDGNATLVTSGLVQIFSRYVSVAWWNGSDNALASSGNMVILTPVPDELQ